MQDGDTRVQDEVAVFAFLERGLGCLPRPVPPDRIQQLTDLITLLATWAPRINLTGHRDPLEMAGRLVLDAAALVACLPELEGADTLADLGTGAGFPGLPIAILVPDLDVVLVDSRKKRNHFQREARRRLDLSNVRSVLGRAELVEVRPSSVVTAQAMTQPTAALDLMRRWSKDTGLLVLPASEAASRPEPPPGVAPAELREYEVPLTGVRRKLWVARATPVAAD